MRLFATILEHVFGGKKEIPDLGNIIRDDIIYSEPKKKKMMKLKECGCLPDCACKK